ncbi:MAG: hypothetical protein RLZZ450_899 [Pseudomonadota bacterium]
MAPPAEPATPDVIAAPVSTTPPAEPTHTRSRLAPYALWGTSVVSLALGTVFGVMALGAKQDYDDAPTYKRADKVHNLGIAADTGLGLGLLLAITGTVFYFVTPESDKTTHAQTAGAGTLRIAPLFSHHAQGGTLALRF